MAWGPSVVCEVRSNKFKPIELRINTQQLDKAEAQYMRAGGGNECSSICIKVRAVCKKQLGYDPGWLEYHDIKIVRLRDLPATGKKTP